MVMNYYRYNPQLKEIGENYLKSVLNFLITNKLTNMKFQYTQLPLTNIEKDLNKGFYILNYHDNVKSIVAYEDPLMYFILKMDKKFFPKTNFIIFNENNEAILSVKRNRHFVFIYIDVLSYPKLKNIKTNLKDIWIKPTYTELKEHEENDVLNTFTKLYGLTEPYINKIISSIFTNKNIIEMVVTIEKVIVVKFKKDTLQHWLVEKALDISPNDDYYSYYYEQRKIDDEFRLIHSSFILNKYSGYHFHTFPAFEGKDKIDQDFLMPEGCHKIKKDKFTILSAPSGIDTLINHLIFGEYLKKFSGGALGETND